MFKSLRMLALIGACAMLVTGPAEARRHSYHVYTSHSGSSDYYTARSGHRVHRPVQSSHAPSGASAQCGDGSWSFSESRRGTCSHHGGVSRWM